jgi:hypothetical protein
MYKRAIFRVLVVTLLQSAYVVTAQEQVEEIKYDHRDLYSDTWVATDGLGRELPGLAEARPVQQDKFVGMFYWTWHVPRGDGSGPNDNTKIIAAAKNGNVDWPNNGVPHHWGEPELGYYMMTDPFVIRKHASMLVDAGVDVVFFDTTNPPFTWKAEYERLCAVYTQMRAEGNRTPSIGFIGPFGDPMPMLNRVWEELYKPGLWSDLWFRWEGKPMILANKEYVKDPEMLKFFTFRRPMPDYWVGPSGPDQWSWLETYPQHVFRNQAGEAEQMSVGVAHNALPDTPGPAPMSHKDGAMGRSWHNGAKDTRKGAVNLGLNFSEQWNRVLEVDPKFVFVTGWNEWIAGRFQEWSKYTEADSYIRGGLFVDQYDQEYSRDCEPMRGGHTDNYYYQLAGFVRKFKGVNPLPLVEESSNVELDGNFEDWVTVMPEFRDAIGDVTHRNHKGYGGKLYTNTTGRNDIVVTKATYSEDELFFLVQTREPITSYSDSMWMLLLLDTDQDASTGWLGYDYVINQEVLSEAKTTLKRWTSEGVWEFVDTVHYHMNGNGLELSVPRKLLGYANEYPAFDFHWADSIQSFTDVSELGLNGDSAPNRRWNYRFQVKTNLLD